MSSLGLAWLTLGASILASIAGQTLLKAGASAADFRSQLLDPRSLIGLAAYGVAAVFYMVALRRLSMAVALPLTSATYLGAALVGFLVFGERLNVGQISGLAVIGAGVLILGLSTR